MFLLETKNFLTFCILASSLDVVVDARPIKRAKVKSSDGVGPVNKTKQVESSNSHVFFSPSSHPLPPTTTVAVPLSCFINPELQQQQQQQAPLSGLPSASSSFTLDLNSFKTNAMNIIFAPPSSVASSNSSQSSPPSGTPLVLTFGNLPYAPT